MTAEQIERAAMKAPEMPEGLNTAEQLLFQKFRYLYAAARSGQINRDQGHQEKMRILSAFNTDMLREKIWNQHIEIAHRYEGLLAEAMKSDCERCKRLVRIFDGKEAHP